MAVVLNINGANFNFPTDGEEGWGTSVTAWASAVSTGLLQKAGGNFSLSAEINFGDAHSIRGQYFKFISGVGGDNKNIELKAPDSPIAASYSLVLPTTQGVQYDIIKFSAAGIMSVGKVDNSNISDSAAIALTKLASITASRVLVSNGSGVIDPSNITATELDFLDNLTENVQDAINEFRSDIATLDTALGTTNTNITTLDGQNVKLTGDQSISGVKTFNSKVQVEKAAASTPVNISASNIDFSAGSVFSKTLSANTTFTFSNTSEGQTILVLLTNTASNYTAAFPGSVKWQNGEVPVLTTGAKSDLFSFTVVGGVVYGAVIQNF